MNIERATSFVKEEKGQYKSKLEDLVNYRDSDDNEVLQDNSISEVITVSDNEKLPELYPVGLLLGTYIVCENEKGIYLIDQHAAKERINYEKVSYQLSHPDGNTIRPIVPIVLELPQNEYLILKENLDILANLKIEIEEFGVSSVRVVSHPTWWNTGYEEETFRRIVELIINKEKDFSSVEFYKEKDCAIDIVLNKLGSNLESVPFIDINEELQIDRCDIKKYMKNR